MSAVPVSHSASASASASALASLLPPRLAAALWRGSDLGRSTEPVLGSGWARLDAELPGGGWPCGSLTEILLPQLPLLEWRLLGPALRAASRQSQRLVLVAPPAVPCLPGLQLQGLDPANLVWVRSQQVADSVWAASQVLQSQAAVVLLWLPACRADTLRRLHAHAQGGRAPLFVLRHEQAGAEASPAPLRVHARADAQALYLRLLKRRGPAHDEVLRLPSRPAGLEDLLDAAPSAQAGRGMEGGRDAVGRLARRSLF